MHVLGVVLVHRTRLRLRIAPHHPRQRRAARVRGRRRRGDGVGGPSAAAASRGRVVGRALLHRRWRRRRLAGGSAAPLLLLGVRCHDALLNRREPLAQARLGTRHHLVERTRVGRRAAARGARLRRRHLSRERAHHLLRTLHLGDHLLQR
eukprot:scaffold72067_cov63-Phaeocystis_antarctica.AAC.5